MFIALFILVRAYVTLLVFSGGSSCDVWRRGRGLAIIPGIWNCFPCSSFLLSESSFPVVSMQRQLSCPRYREDVPCFVLVKPQAVVLKQFAVFSSSLFISSSSSLMVFLLFWRVVSSLTVGLAGPLLLAYHWCMRELVQSQALSLAAHHMLFPALLILLFPTALIVSGSLCSPWTTPVLHSWLPFSLVLQRVFCGLCCRRLSGYPRRWLSGICFLFFSPCFAWSSLSPVLCFFHFQTQSVAVPISHLVSS